MGDSLVRGEVDSGSGAVGGGGVPDEGCPTEAALAGSESPPGPGVELPLSFAQERLLFLDRFEPGCIAFNVPQALRLHGPLDGEALRRALGEVVRRHEALRARFPNEDGAPRLVIDEPSDFPLPVVQVKSAPGDGREDEARRLAVAEARCPFDLARGPLLRGLLLRLAGGGTGSS
jgi:hypothetical protein